MLGWLFWKLEPEPELTNELVSGQYCTWCGAQHRVLKGYRRFYDARTGMQREWEPWQTACPNGHRSKRPDSRGL